MRDWTALAAAYPDRFVWVDGRPVPAIAGGTSSAPKVPPPPGPTAQEIAIQEQQVKVLQQQVAQLERQNEINAGIPAQEIVSLQREQLALAREEMERARVRGPQEQAVALRQLQIAEQQLAMAERGMKLQDALQPFVLQSMRLVEEPGGGIRRMTEEEFVATLPPTDKLAYENLQLSLERERKALLGELPLSEAGQRQKRDEFTAFKEQMARGGNPIEGDTPETATASTTAGAQNLKAFTERWALAEEAERRGELSAGSQTVLQRLGVASDLGVRQREGLLSAVTGYSVPSAYLGGGAGPGSTGIGLPQFGAITPDFAGALQPFQAQRAGIHSTNMANAQLRMAQQQQDNARNAAIGTGAGAVLGGVLGTFAFPGIGTVAGAGMGAALGGGVGYAASERKVKKDIRRAGRREDKRALDTVKRMGLHEFRYKGESGRAPKRMGMMVDEAPAALVTPDGRGIDLHRQVGMLTASVRELARQKGR